MHDPFIHILAGVLVLSALISLFVARRRHSRDYREHLEPVLHGLGLRFVSSVHPGMYRVGPFPKTEWVFGRPQSHVFGIRGEYSEYRIVSFEDPKGRLHQIWAKVQFELFRFRRVRWRAENFDGLPTCLLPILENASS